MRTHSLVEVCAIAARSSFDMPTTAAMSFTLKASAAGTADSVESVVAVTAAGGGGGSVIWNSRNSCESE